ncbi:MAG: hypothetical protein LBL63_01665 [Clostridiales Family XIII bacterium]|nr:hypothetical protein [Clostridiales Family XIII bacterium]
MGDPVKEKIVAAVKEKAEKTIASMFGSTFASILSEEEKGTADEEGEEEKEEEKEEEEDKKKAIDAELAAKLSLGGRYETSRPAANKETVIVSMDVAASASASLTAVGVSLSKSAEGSFSASIERRFTDDKLTGATMARTYKIGGDTAAKDAKEILASFGLANAALESDLGGEYAGFKEMTLVVEADMTQDGMRKYRESAAKGKTVNDMFILSDRDNYAGMRVRLETVLDEASYERALSAEVKVDALGEGGAVRAGFKKGAKGELLEYRRYNARKRKEKKKSA